MRILPINNTQIQNNKKQSLSFNGNLVLKTKKLTDDLETSMSTGYFDGFLQNFYDFFSTVGNKIDVSEVNQNPYHVILNFDKNLDKEVIELLSRFKNGNSRFARYIEDTFTPSP